MYWMDIETVGLDTTFYAHSAILYGDDIYCIGGRHSGRRYVADIYVLNISISHNIGLS